MTLNAGSTMSWMQHKEAAKTHFQNDRYAQALSSYQAAVVNAPEAEKQILLSNCIACRLKIGGPAMAEAAVEDAKRCIALNDRWAKGHVRLASAYIALGGHSNHACNSLQRAIALDSSNQTARQMLTKELRRDKVPPAPSAPSEDLDDSQRRQQQQRPQQQPRYNDVPPADAANIDDGLSMTDRVKFYWMRVITWYHELPEDARTTLKVIAGLVVLYVMLGGRFGLGRDPILRGNYGQDSAYDRYRPGSYGQQDYRTKPSGGGYAADPRQGRDPHANNHHTQHGGGGSAHHGSYDQRRTDSYEEDGYAQPRGRGSSSSFHFPNLFDGSVPSMICLGGIMYACHRAGINPFQVMMMMNMMGGRGRNQRGMGMGGMGMGGMGMGAMGYGMARNGGMFGGGRGRPRRGF